MTRRTSLRPADLPEPVISAPEQPTVPRDTVGGGSAWSRRFIVGGVAVVTIAALVAGALLSRPGPESPPVSVATVPQTCPSIASFLDVITSYERQAHWTLAASTAQTALRTPGLCDIDRIALGEKAIALGQQALFEQPPTPEDVTGQRRAVTAYTDLKSLAGQYGAPPPAPLPIAQTAYDSRLFLLATAAYADAFANGDSSAQDRDVVRGDYAAQYSLGLAWSQRVDPEQRSEGLARLVTACRIDESQQLGSAEACTQLLKVVGPRGRWPAPVADPLIESAPSPAAARGI